MIANLSNDSPLFERLRKNEIRIEVKTRRNQDGDMYLSSLKPDKFDLLCVVDLAKNYTLKRIDLVDSIQASKFLDTKYQRLIFKNSMAFMTLDGYKD